MSRTDEAEDEELAKCGQAKVGRPAHYYYYYVSSPFGMPARGNPCCWPRLPRTPAWGWLHSVAVSCHAGTPACHSQGPTDTRATPGPGPPRSTDCTCVMSQTQEGHRQLVAGSAPCGSKHRQHHHHQSPLCSHQTGDGVNPVSELPSSSRLPAALIRSTY